MSTHHHLSLDQRALIQTHLVAHASFQAIASLLDKDPTTIAKEVKKQRIELAIGYHNCTHNDCVHRITCTRRFICSPCSRGRRLCKLCGLCNQTCPLELARKIRMSLRKKSKTLKIERACRVGRTYLDYQAFLLANDHPAVVQMDTIEGLKGGSNILTIFFETSGLMLAFKRSCNNALSVITLMNDLYQRLDHATYTRLFGVLLCGNGSEFSHPSALEFTPEGHRRSHLFYCDPGAHYQKGGCERNHEFIRMILPKGSDFDPWTQDDFNLILDHINAYPRKRLNDRSPANLFSQLESPQLLAILGVSFIAPNAINLTPSLLRK